MEFLTGLLWFLAPVFGGFGLYFVAGKCRGRNAKKAFTSAAWGTWLLLLMWMPIAIFPFPIGFLNLILAVAPSVICYLLAANAMLKEMRAQKVGDYTDAA